MNEEERAVVMVMINTGARPSEIINLRRKHIMLDAPIPFIRVRPGDRVLKTAFSDRDIPLVGISLEAMRQFPDGFPHYRDKGDTLSAAVNAYFSDHGLRETDSHTLYSLRHGFKDRLRSVETPDELKDELMGHDTKKSKYGNGHGVDLKWKYIQLIALARRGCMSPLRCRGRRQQVKPLLCQCQTGAVLSPMPRLSQAGGRTAARLAAPPSWQRRPNSPGGAQARPKFACQPISSHPMARANAMNDTPTNPRKL